MVAFHRQSELGILSAMEDAPGVRPCPTETASLFATSFHYFTLVSFRHTSGTANSTEFQEETSGKNDSSESKTLFLAKGHHQVQHPSVLSLSQPTPSLLSRFQGNKQLVNRFILSCRRVTCKRLGIRIFFLCKPLL